MENSFNSLNKLTKINLALSYENLDFILKFCDEYYRLCSSRGITIAKLN
jgi:hypothetical protein